MMLNLIYYQVSKPEMEFHMINIMYVALPMRAQTGKTTFSCKDDSRKALHIYWSGGKATKLPNLEDPKKKTTYMRMTTSKIKKTLKY